MSDTLFTPFDEDNQDDTVTTMGGLGGLPGGDDSAASYLSRELPQLDFGNFLGTASQIAQLFPGIQTRPNYVPGLTDISMTRGFYGTGEDVRPEEYGSGSPGHLFWERGGFSGLPTAQTTTTATTTSGPSEEDFLRAALNINWFGGGSGGGGGTTTPVKTTTTAQTTTTVATTTTAAVTVSSGIDITTSLTPTTTTATVTVTSGLGTITTTTPTSLIDTFTTTTAVATVTSGLDIITTTTPTTTTAAVTVTSPLDVFTTTTAVDSITTTTPTTVTAVTTVGGGLDTITTATPTTTTPGRELTADQKIVNDIYLDLFGREAEAGGLDNWDDRLAAGVTPDQLRREIRAAAQNADIEAVKRQDEARTINGIYQDLLGRTAEPAAIEFWGKQLREGVPVTTLVDRIAAGAQGADIETVKGQNIKAVADEAFVRDAYRNLYGREASEAEVNYHTDAMKNGLAREQFVNNMFVGGQGADAANLGKYREQANQLNNFVTDFSRDIRTGMGAFDAAPEVVREEFVKQLASTNPELFQSLFGDSISQATKDISGGLGTAGNVIGVAQALLSADSVADAAGNLTEVFGRQLIAEGASMAMTALGIPVVGPVVSAAIMLDSFLSSVIGYDSPIQDAVGWLAGIVEDVVGGIGKQFEKAGKWFKARFRAEGGLIDMPDDMSYNYTDYYGGLSSIPQTDVLPPMEFAGGGLIPLVGGGKVAVGPGGGLDDLIPTSIDGRRAAALSDGEFVIPADVVSMMGDGSTNAGSRRLYDLVRQIRQEKTGTSKQAGPLPVDKILERTMR